MGRKHAMFTKRLAGGLVLVAVVAGGMAVLTRMSRTLQAPGVMTSEEARRRQQEQADARGVPVRAALDCGGGGACMDVVLIPAGEYRMGSPERDDDAYLDEKPRHEVRISRPFYLGVTEVTQAQWNAVMGTEPWQGKRFVREGAANAANYISWDAATAFCKALAARTGRAVRLPTEAEWEYACRAGTATRYCFGEDDAALGDYAWCEDNTRRVGGEYAHPVGRKKANAWGLHDMHGNVMEWCGDWYNVTYYAAAGNATDPTGPSTGGRLHRRVLRGGGWGDAPGWRRSACRDYGDPDRGGGGSGFRVVVVLGAGGR